MAALDLRIRQLSFARYRCFRDPTTVDLSRLTLVYGENNTGKSAVVRMLPIFADSRTPGQAGLNTDSEVLGGSSTRQLLWSGPHPPAEDNHLEFGLRFEDGTSWQWRFLLEGGERRPELRLAVELVDAEERHTEIGDEGLDGIVPKEESVGVNSVEARRQLIAALASVTWLGPNRVGPARVGAPPGTSGRVWADGAKAEANCLDDAVLRRGVSRFYEEHLSRQIDKETLGQDRDRLVLAPTTEATFSTSFQDSGLGLQYLFPVVCALESLRAHGGLLVVEEPDAHLHPRLQRALARHVASVLAANDRAQVLLETHSEIFLLAALDAAAPGGLLLPEQVSLHWVEQAPDGSASTESIELDERGRPKTPRLEQAFETMGLMRREILRKRRHAR